LPENLQIFTDFMSTVVLFSLNTVRYFKCLKKNRMARHVICMGGGGRGAYRVLVRNGEGLSPAILPRHRWEYNIKMGLKEIGWEGLNWIHLAQDGDKWWALVNSVMNTWAP
jgi:hypothetical protein